MYMAIENGGHTYAVKSILYDCTLVHIYTPCSHHWKLSVYACLNKSGLVSLSSVTASFTCHSRSAGEFSICINSWLFFGLSTIAARACARTDPAPWRGQ